MKFAKVQEVRKTLKVIKKLSDYLEPKNVALRVKEKGKISLLNIMLQIYKKTILIIKKDMRKLKMKCWKKVA